MKVMILDGQGGGVGRALIEALRKLPGERFEITAVGTNAVATSNMLKGGADQGATGENAAVFCASHCDVIAGSIGILAANSMLGEISPAIAAAVAESSAVKVLIPMNRCRIFVVGISEERLPKTLEQAAAAIAGLSGSRK